MKKNINKVLFDKKKELLIIFFLTLCFLFFRFAKLKSSPSTIMIDEASHGYIAYSLLKTGKDEHGQSWPLMFKAFGDQKLPVYAYSLIPFLKFLPLETWVVRLPSVISGILFVFLMYFFLIELKFNHKEALFGATVAGFSSWTFILSRFAYESNLALLFFTSFLFFFLKAIRRQKKVDYFLFPLFAALSIYSYISYRLITPIFIVILYIYYLINKFTKNKRKKIFYSLFVFLILVLPIFLLSNSDNNLARFQQVGILSDQGMVLEINEKRTFCAIDYPRIVCDLIWNKGSFLLKKIFFTYLNIFSPNYLFLAGDQNLTYMNVDGFGQFSFLLLPFYLFAIVFLLKNDLNKEQQLFKFFLLIAFIITPLPAVLSGIQKVRLSPMLPFFITFLTLGFRELLKNCKSEKIKNFIFFLILFILPIHFLFYFINFTSIHLRKNLFAYDAYVPKIVEISQKYLVENKIVFIEAFYSDPLMYYAFYQKIDPDYYQKNIVLGVLEKSGFQHAQALDNYRVVHSLAEATELAKASQKEVIYITNKQSLTKKYLLENVWLTDPTLVYAQVYDLSNFILEENNEQKNIN